jgi:hypothetical protein
MEQLSHFGQNNLNVFQLPRNNVAGAAVAAFSVRSRVDKVVPER